MAKKTVGVIFDVALAKGSAEGIRSELNSVLASVGDQGIQLNNISISPSAASDIRNTISRQLEDIPITFSLPTNLWSLGIEVGSSIRRNIKSALGDIEDIYSKIGAGTRGDEAQQGLLGGLDFTSILNGFAEFQSNVVDGMSGIRDAIQSSIELLRDLGSAARDVASKEFTTALDFSGAFKGQNVEQIDEYKAKIRDYVQYAKEASAQLLQEFSGSVGRKRFEAAGIDTGSLGRLILGAGSGNENIMDTLDSYLNKIDSKKSLSGLREVGDSVREYVEKIRGAFEAMSSMSSKGAAIDLDKLFNVPDKPVTAAKQATDAFSSITDALQALSQGATQSSGQALSQEATNIEQINGAYESHSSAVTSAANAEMLKASASQEVASSVAEEAAAVVQASESAASDADASSAAMEAKRESIASIAEETAALKENEAVKRDASKGADNESSKQQAYDKILKRVASSLRQVQDAKHDLGGKPGGQDRSEYGVLSGIEDELKSLQEAGESNPLDKISSSLDSLMRRFEEARQTVGVFKNEIKDADSDAKASASAQKDLDSALDRYRKAMTLLQSARARGDTVHEVSYAEDVKNKEAEYRRLAESITDVAERERALNEIDRIRQELTDAGTDAIQRNADAQDDLDRSRQASLAANFASNIESQIGEFDGLTQAIITNTSAYREWREAQESFDAGMIDFSELQEKAYSLMGVMNEFLPASQTMSGTFSRLFGSLSNRALMSSIAVASRAIRDMISSVKELDAAFTQMQIVTGGSDMDIERFGINIAQTAKSIGSSITDLVDSATVFARLGYTEGESTSLAKFTSMLSNVGNIDVSTAQNAITAIVKAYGMGVDDVEGVMDKMVEVGNHFPISVAQIAEGMTNAGSTLKVAGNDINQSIALLTAANTSMQDISKSSTGLRTIAARLRRSETELNELGESVTTAKYQQMVDMLTKHSVSLVDENGELRDTYSIIQDIAAAWGDMSKNEQAALAEMAAGTRQQNVFTSLLLNFKEAQNAMSAMESSAGSLTSAYDIYMESIQAHTGMFKAAFQELAQSLFESGTITGAIDIGTKVIETLRPIASGIANITDAVGGLNGALSILAGAIVIKNLTKIIGTVHNVITGAKHLGEVVSGLVSSLSIVSKSEFGPGQLIMSGGAVAGIGVAIAAMAAYVAYVQRWKAAQEELRTATYDNAKAESNRLDTFEKIRNRYEELSAMAEAGTLGEEGYREIASLQSQIEANQGSINSLIGTQAGQVDLVNGKYQEQIALLNQIVGEQAKEAADSAQRASDRALTDYINAYDDSSALNDDSVLRTINGRIDYISEHLNRDVDWSFLSPSGEEIDFTGNFTEWLKSGTKNAGELSEALKTIYDDLANNNDWQGLVDKRYGANYHVQLLSDIWSEYEIYNNKVKDVKNSVSELSEALLAQEANGKRATEPFEDFASYNEYRNQLAGKLLEDQRVIGALREGVIDTSYLASQIDSTLASIAPDMFKKYREAIGSGTETTMKEIVNTMPSMVGKSGMLTGVEDVSENITKLYGWLDKINSGDFDTKDLFDMLNEFPNLQSAADGIDNLSTDLWKLADAVQGAINAAPDDMIKRIDDYMDSHILSDSVKSQMETWKEYLRGMTDLTNVSMPEHVSKLKEMQSAIYDAVGDTSGVTLDQYNNLIKINGELADAIELDGDRVVVNTEKAMSIVRKMGVEYIDTINAQIDADTKRIATLDAIEKARGELTSSEAAERASLEQNIQKYQTLRGEILNTLSAYEQWSAAQGTANAGSEVDELRAAWEHLNKVTKGGKDKDALFGQIYTDDTRAALALLGKDIEDFTSNGVFDNKKAQEWLKGLNTYLNKGKQGVDDFLLDLRDAGLATYDNGIFQLAEDFELGDAAKALDMSEEMVRAMLDFSTRFHDLDFSYILDGYEKEAEAIEGVTAAKEAESKTQASKDNLEAVEKENVGITNLLNLYDQLRQAESQRAQAQDMGAQGLVDSMDQQIQTIKDNISTVLSEPVDMASIDSVREAINNTIQALNEEMETKKALGIEFDEEAIKSQIDNLTQDLSDIEAVVDISTTQQADADAGALETTAALLDSLKAKIDEISESETKPSVDTSSIENAINVATELGTALAEATVDRVVNISTNFAGSVKDFWEKGKIKVGGNAGAQGGAFANGGNTLVGELGQEMVVDPENKYWYTVGDNGPEFIKLPKHAIVFNHKQTKSLLSRGKTNDRGTALASGTALAVASGAGGAQKKLEDAVSGLIGAAVKAMGGGTADLKRVNPKGKSKGSGSGGGGGSGSGSGSGKKSSDKDNWFIKQYKENNHLVKMDKKEQKDYLNWLDGAYKKAYKQGIIDLDDYRKYAEEVYEGLKDLFLDSIDDTSSKIDEMMNYDGAGKQIVNYYNQIINSVQKELKAAYARGLDDNDDYVQELKSRYWEYANALKEYEEGIVDDAKDAMEELIRYRMKMITKELNDEKDNLKERLKDMKEFYDEQKKLLHESADNEDYLKEQAEKRKKITDLEIQLSQLSLDTSVRAQKKRLELEEDLVKARDELYTFERDHTIGVIEDEYDKMYDTAEKATDAQIEEIDEKLEDQKYLYQTALEDLRNNNLALYNEMIAYNEHYIDGTGDALVDMWERAYEALYEYYKLYGKTFEGIELGNFTNWQPTTANTGTLTINGRKYARGTSNAKAGVHQVDEVGPEQVFVTASGNRYRLFHGGEKVLNAKATQFLYDFANSGGSIISDALRRSSEAMNNLSRAAASIGSVNMGDIIIQGNATEKTVSEIRRSQRESVDYLLKEFKRLGK